MSNCSICIETSNTPHCCVPCGHIYCQTCIEQWMITNRDGFGCSKCPQCRSVVLSLQPVIIDSEETTDQNREDVRRLEEDLNKQIDSLKKEKEKLQQYLLKSKEKIDALFKKICLQNQIIEGKEQLEVEFTLSKDEVEKLQKNLEEQAANFRHEKKKYEEDLRASREEMERFKREVHARFRKEKATMEQELNLSKECREKLQKNLQLQALNFGREKRKLEEQLRVSREQLMQSEDTVRNLTQAIQMQTDSFNTEKEKMEKELQLSQENARQIWQNCDMQLATFKTEKEKAEGELIESKEKYQKVLVERQQAIIHSNHEAEFIEKQKGRVNELQMTKDTLMENLEKLKQDHEKLLKRLKTITEEKDRNQKNLEDTIKERDKMVKRTLSMELDVDSLEKENRRLEDKLNIINKKYCVLEEKHQMVIDSYTQSEFYRIIIEKETELKSAKDAQMALITRFRQEQEQLLETLKKTTEQKEQYEKSWQKKFMEGVKLTEQFRSLEEVLAALRIEKHDIQEELNTSKREHEKELELMQQSVNESNTRILSLEKNNAQLQDKIVMKELEKRRNLTMSVVITVLGVLIAVIWNQFS